MFPVVLSLLAGIAAVYLLFKGKPNLFLFELIEKTFDNKQIKKRK